MYKFKDTMIYYATSTLISAWISLNLYSRLLTAPVFVGLLIVVVVISVVVDFCVAAVVLVKDE